MNIYFHEQGVDSVLLPALDFMRTDKNSERDKMQFAHRTGIFDIARVIIVHSVNVGPDLDFVRANGRTDQRCSLQRYVHPV